MENLRGTSQRGGAAPRSVWVEAGGLRLHALCGGRAEAGAGETIVLVSGLGVSSSYMAPALRELSADAEVYAPDLPGFGPSDKPAHTLSVPELADALAAWMTAAGVGRGVLIGHSFGCQIVADFAVRYPEGVSGAVLAAPTGDPRRRSALGQIFRLVLNAPREPVSLVPLVVRDYLRAGLVRGARTLSASLRDRVEEKLPRVGAPALVVRGSRDPIVSGRWAGEVARLLPRARLVTVEGVAHAVNYNSPGRFARVVREFARGL